MKACYREKKYICGNYIDMQIFPVFPAPRNYNRRIRRKPTSEVQAQLNEKNAREKLSRLVKSNFVNGDYELTLTYTPEKLPADEEQAKRDIQNYFRRLNYLYKKHGVELRYIWTMELSDNGTIHFHIFLSGGIDRTEIENVWGRGYANVKALRFDKNGVDGLIYYTTKNKPLLYRRWSGSKNLKKPTERQNDGRITYGRAKKLYEAVKVNDDYAEFKRIYPRYSEILKDYEIAGIEPLYNEFNGDYYFYIRLYKPAALYDSRQRRRE